VCFVVLGAFVQRNTVPVWLARSVCADVIARPLSCSYNSRQASAVAPTPDTMSSLLGLQYDSSSDSDDGEDQPPSHKKRRPDSDSSDDDDEDDDEEASPNNAGNASHSAFVLPSAADLLSGALPAGGVPLGLGLSAAVGARGPQRSALGSKSAQKPKTSPAKTGSGLMVPPQIKRPNVSTEEKSLWSTDKTLKALQRKSKSTPPRR